MAYSIGYVYMTGITLRNKKPLCKVCAIQIYEQSDRL